MVVEPAEESDNIDGVDQYNHVHGVGDVTSSTQVVGGVKGYCEKLELEGQETARRNK